MVNIQIICIRFVIVVVSLLLLSHKDSFLILLLNFTEVIKIKFKMYNTVII